MDGQHNVFNIICAPTPETLKRLIEFAEAHVNNIIVFFEINLDTYLTNTKTTNDDGAPRKVDVYNIPTNMRTPYALRPGRKSPIKFCGVTLHNLETFKQCQDQVSISLKGIFEFVTEKGIHTYFPFVERDQRPTHFQLVDQEAVAMPPDTKEYQTQEIIERYKAGVEGTTLGEIIEGDDGNSEELHEDYYNVYSRLEKIPSMEDGSKYYVKNINGKAHPHTKRMSVTHKGSDQELSQFVLDKLVRPAFIEDGTTIEIELENCTGYNASYLADVLAVVCGACVSSETVPFEWERWNMTRAEIKHDGTHSKKIFGEDSGSDIPYCQAKFERSDSGIFHSMNSKKLKHEQVHEFKERVRDFINRYDANRTDDKIWDTCHIEHDDRALDVDDLPAIKLSEFLTNPGSFSDYKSWRELTRAELAQLEVDREGPQFRQHFLLAQSEGPPSGGGRRSGRRRSGRRRSGRRRSGRRRSGRRRSGRRRSSRISGRRRSSRRRSGRRRSSRRRSGRRN
jgi:hypothetical protein